MKTNFNFFNAFRIGFRNLNRNKRRNVVTGIAIVLGFTGLLMLGGYLNRVQNYLKTYSIYGLQFGHIAIYYKDGYKKFSTHPRDYSISAESVKEIQQFFASSSEIERISSKLSASGLIGNGCRSVPFLATGVDPMTDSWARSHKQMRAWAENISNLRRGKIIAQFEPILNPIGVSTGLAYLLNKPRVRDEIKNPDNPIQVDCSHPDLGQLLERDANVQIAMTSWDGMFTAIDAEIVNHFTTGLNETENNSILIDIATLQKLLNTQSVSSVAVWVTDERVAKETLTNLRPLLSKLNLDGYLWNDPDINPYFYGTMQFLRTMISFISVVLLVIISFSIVNSVTMTVIERSQEIGMMRAMGFKQSDILKLFIAETSLLAFFAIVVATVCAFIAMTSINALDIRFNPPGIAGGMQLKLLANPLTVLLTTIIVLTLALLSTAATVYQASRRKITLLLSSFNR